MEIKSFASSSKGNSYIIKYKNTCIILECGLPFKDIKKEVDGCDAYVLLSHEHQDHAKYVETYLKMGIDVYTSNGTKNALIEKNSKLSKYINFKSCYEKFIISFKEFYIYAFSTQHDSREPFGFYIKNYETKECVLFATDTYYIKQRFSRIDYLMIECNYSKDLLEKDLYISKAQKIRLLQSHFEIENVKNFIKNNNKFLKEIYLLHLSSKHSNSKQFKEEIERISGVPTFICNE